MNLNQPPPPDGTVRVLLLSKEENFVPATIPLLDRGVTLNNGMGWLIRKNQQGFAGIVPMKIP